MPSLACRAVATGDARSMSSPWVARARVLRARGMRVGEVAAQFGVSPRTVQRHLRQERDGDRLAAVLRTGSDAELDRRFARLPADTIRTVLARLAQGASPTLRKRLQRVRRDLEVHRRRGRPAVRFGIYLARAAQICWITRCLALAPPPHGRWTWKRIAARFRAHRCTVPARSLPRALARLGLAFCPRRGVVQAVWWRILPIARILTVAESITEEDAWRAERFCRCIHREVGRTVKPWQLDRILAAWIRRLAAPGVAGVGTEAARDFLQEWRRQARDRSRGR